MSYLATGRYYDSKLFKPSPVTGQSLADDVYAGANNVDGGSIGVDDALWNPHNSALLKLNVVSPPEFGPEIAGIFPFEGWSLSSSTRWVQGNLFTWYPTDYTGFRMPNNRRWEDRWNTNMTLSRRFRLSEGLSMKVFVQVTNLFNEHHLRQYAEGSSDLVNSMTSGQLPIQATTKEPTVWNYYTNDPRQIYFGTTIEF
jgi:hypothetical protein